MRKVLLINGSPNEHGCTAAALEEIVCELKKEGIGCDTLWLGRKAAMDCIACGHCRQAGCCIFEDEVNEVARKLDEYGAMIVGSPVYYGGPTGRLTSFMDRLFFSVPGDKLAGKFAASVVSCRRGGASAAFERLNQYFLMTNMTVVASQYWNQVHGFTHEDVARDAEGLQTMRTLARNMAWLMKLREQGEQGGISLPVHEPHIATNFI